MMLVYDSKCSICRNLAQKIHSLSDEAVEILPLSSPAAYSALEEFYPDGWEHDFYVIAGGKCHKGLRALPRLMKDVGIRNMAGLMAEYGSYKLQLQPAATTNGMQRSKRNLLKYAALSPLVYAAGKAGTSEAAEVAPANGLMVHVAEIERLGGEFKVKVYRCDNCLKTPEKMQPLAAGSAVHGLENKILVDGSVNSLEFLRGQNASHKIQRMQYERESLREGKVSRDRKIVHSSMLEHSRYNIALSFGQGFRTMAAGMANHDLPTPALDYVVMKGAGVEDATEYFAAYAAGVRKLAGLHRRAGRTELARVYLDMANGLELSGARFAEHVGLGIVPGDNELVITSMPESLKFLQKPEHLRTTKAEADEGGCDCSCSCGACCGCGCSLGLCLEPISPCGCDCCLACGCGCGCCL